MPSPLLAIALQVVHPPPLAIPPDTPRPTLPRPADPNRIDPPTRRLDHAWPWRRDLPPAALAGGGSKSVGLVVTVGTSGLPGNCRITRRSDSPALDAATCASFVRRVRFHPARNAVGTPVVAEYRASHDWRTR